MSKLPTVIPVEAPTEPKASTISQSVEQSSTTTTGSADASRSHKWTSVGTVVAVIVVALVYSLISPYWATYRLYEALANRDAELLSRVVAFDDLRENLKRRASGAVTGMAIDSMVTPANVMEALGTKTPPRSDNQPLLLIGFASGRHDGSGHFIVANTVVFCRYWLNWRVCDLSP